MITYEKKDSVFRFANIVFPSTPEGYREEVVRYCTNSLDSFYRDKDKYLVASKRFSDELAYLDMVEDSYRTIWEVKNIICGAGLDLYSYIMLGPLAGSMVIYLLELSRFDPLNIAGTGKEAITELVFPGMVTGKLSKISFRIVTSLKCADDIYDFLQTDHDASRNLHFLDVSTSLYISLFQRINDIRVVSSEIQEPTEDDIRPNGLFSSEFFIFNSIDSKTKTTLNGIYGSREELYEFIVSRGVSGKDAVIITESVRRGRGFPDDKVCIGETAPLPDGFINMCKRIVYLPSRYSAIWEYMVNAHLIWLRDKYSEIFYEVWDKVLDEYRLSGVDT